MSCNTTSETNLVSAAINNFRIYSGDTFTSTLTFTDSNNSPIDLSGCTLKLAITKGTTVMLLLTEVDGMAIGGVGFNVITINKEQTLPVGVYKYSLEVTFPTSPVKVVTYIAGNFSVISY